MESVNFGEYNSYTDFELILSNKTIGNAEAKIETVDIPGGNGVIDYTEYFGDIHYKNRKLTFEFSTIVPQSEFLTLFSTIQNAIHGKKLKIGFNSEPDFYYYGRVSVNEWKSNGRIGRLTIEVDAEPWKYHESETVITYVASGTHEIVLPNDRRPAIPVILATANMAITFGTNIYNIVANVEYSDPEIMLTQGNNFITVSGAGTISFTWQEGGL